MKENAKKMPKSGYWSLKLSECHCINEKDILTSAVLCSEQLSVLHWIPFYI